MATVGVVGAKGRLADLKRLLQLRPGTFQVPKVRQHVAEVVVPDGHVGVVGASVVAIQLGLGTLPDDMTARHLWGLGALGGIGFTVALFVTDLAYSSVPGIGVDPAKIAILAASLVGGLLGATLLARADPAL
jgi:Na+/H+ antiporter NhaA